MPVTLQDAKVGMTDKIVAAVVDEFIQESTLLELLTFDDAVSPQGGSTLGYMYQRVKEPSTASFRAINTEYPTSEAVREDATAKLAILGGMFSLDRVLNKTSAIALNEFAFQMSQKVKAACALFHDTVINGSVTDNKDSFDGLKTLLEGTTTDFTSTLDISTTALVDTKYNDLIDELDSLIAEVPGANAIFVNSKMKTKIAGVARRAGYFSHIETAFGKKVEAYNGIPFIDLGSVTKEGTSVPVIPIETDGTTSIYVVKLGLDGFHGISLAGGSAPIEVFYPNWELPQAQHQGSCELIAGCVLKATKAAARLKGIKIQPPASRVATPQPQTYTPAPRA